MKSSIAYFPPWKKKITILLGLFTQPVAMFRKMAIKRNTEAKLLEREYRRLVENLSEAVALWDCKGRLRYCNPAADAMWGKTPDFAADLNRGWQLLGPDGEPLSPQLLPISICLREGRPVRGQELLLVRPDGSRKHIMPNPTPLFNPTGRLLGAVDVLVDITAERERESRMRQLEMEEKVRLEKVICDAQEKERQHIGQELHDNINQILACAQLVIGAAKDYYSNVEKLEECLDMARSRVEDAIVEIRRLSHQLAPSLLNDSCLKDVFRALLEGFDPGNRYAIHLVVDDQLDTLGEETPIHLYRILQEQLKNIHKYAGARRIDVILQRRRDQVQLLIGDDGRGFDPATASKGIGLNSMRKRAAALGGKLRIDSAPGKGCVIRVTIPMVNPARVF